MLQEKERCRNRIWTYFPFFTQTNNFVAVEFLLTIVLIPRFLVYTYIISVGLSIENPGKIARYQQLDTLQKFSILKHCIGLLLPQIEIHKNIGKQIFIKMKLLLQFYIIFGTKVVSQVCKLSTAILKCSCRHLLTTAFCSRCICSPHSP